MRVLRNGSANGLPERSGPGPLLPGDSFQLAASRAAGSDAARPVNGAAALAAPHTLLALQEFADRDYRRRKLIQRGQGLLDTLDRVYHDLLGGEVPPERAGELADRLRQLRTEPDDPLLDGLLQQIELRCAVELAKLERPAS